MDDKTSAKVVLATIATIACLFAWPPLGLIAGTATGIALYRRHRQIVARRRFVQWRGNPANQVGLSIEEANAYRRAANRERKR